MSSEEFSSELIRGRDTVAAQPHLLAALAQKIAPAAFTLQSLTLENGTEIGFENILNSIVTC